MATKKIEKIWNAAPKIGRPRVFESPQTLWESAVEYFEYTDTRFIPKVEWKGKPLRKVTTNLAVPYTYSSFFIFIGIGKSTWVRYRNEEQYKDFWEIADKIDEIIYNNKFDGATVGMFNSTIIARDLKLTEHTETKSVSVNKFDTSSLSKEDKELLFDLSLKMKQDVR